jgi:hypothetical protein
MRMVVLWKDFQQTPVGSIHVMTKLLGIMDSERRYNARIASNISPW